jgi:hypothetical protein
MDESQLREAAEFLGAKPDDPIEKVIAILKDAGVHVDQPGSQTSQDDS